MGRPKGHKCYETSVYCKGCGKWIKRSTLLPDQKNCPECNTMFRSKPKVSKFRENYMTVVIRH